MTKRKSPWKVSHYVFDRKFDQSVGGLVEDPDAEDSGKRKIYLATDWDEAGTIESSGQFFFKPMLGILAQEKLIPLRYSPLQVELELVSSASGCMFVGVQNGLTCTGDLIISDTQCKMELLTLDPSLQNQYASHLLSGKSLPISFSSFNHSNQATSGDKDFSAHINRALTRLKSVCITLYREGATATLNPGHREICNDFYHPASSSNLENLEAGQHQVWLHIASKKVPGYPIRDCTEACYHLRKTAGHPINVFSRWYHSTYISGLDIEKTKDNHSGVNTKAGDLLTINVRGCHESAINAALPVPSRMYCVLHCDAVLNIRSEGVELLVFLISIYPDEN